MFTCPVDTARRMSAWRMSEPFGCTLTASCPPVACFTSSTNCWMLRVWNSRGAYGVVMSQVVCACTAPAAITRTARAVSLFIAVPPCRHYGHTVRPLRRSTLMQIWKLAAGLSLGLGLAQSRALAQKTVIKFGRTSWPGQTDSYAVGARGVKKEVEALSNGRIERPA